MEKTWRWFGKNDKITLSMLRQIGVEGIVTALHEVKNGDVWTVEKIMDLKSYIESAGLRWSVVESLPVSESIKYAGKDRDSLIEKYIISLENLGKSGVKTICYNFMPVLDWARTDLAHRWPDGTESLYFDMVRFAYFDIYILKRKDAKLSYTDDVLEKVEKLNAVVTDADRNELIDSIIVKTQGFVNGNISDSDFDPVSKFRSLMELYSDVDKDVLRANMKYFLEAIMPVCDKYDINMCVHPDDPPFQLLGLPRIVCSDSDIEYFLKMVDNPHNGLTFCAGSLSAGIHNDLPKLAKKYAQRTHFVHLRSTQVLPNGDFYEAQHISGRANIVELCRIFESVNPKLPMRVDHGRLMLGDEDKGYNAGYSFHGRMMGLAQIEGVLAVIDSELGIG